MEGVVAEALEVGVAGEVVVVGVEVTVIGMEVGWMLGCPILIAGD